MTGPHFRNYSR